MGFKDFFKKQNKNIEIDVTKGSNDFNIVEAPNSTGNTFEVAEMYKAAANLGTMKTGEYLESLSDNVADNEINNFINERSLNEWFILQLQANYYTNTINFKCSNPKLEIKIRKVIRAAFLYGKAGLWYDDVLGIWVPVYIWNEKVDRNNNIIEASLYFIADFDKEFKFDEMKADINLDINNSVNLVVFRWGVDAQKALIYHYPFVRLQTQILKQLSLTSLVLAKKVLYYVNGSKVNKNEIKNWLNPFKFVLTLFNSGNKNGRFELFKRENNDNGLAEIEYYKHICNVYYSLFGRRVNDDVKKERNITDEVNSTQENFDILQNNWKSMFRLFIEQLKDSNKGGAEIGEIEVYN